MDIYVCNVCGYVYDSEEEDVPFKDLPENWACPICGAMKAQFDKEQVIEK